jgi:hypothetical protein
MLYPVLTFDQSFYLEASKKFLKKTSVNLTDELEKKIAKAIDRDISRIFQYLSADIMKNDIKSKVQYFAGGIQSWSKLSDRQMRRKKKLGGAVKLPHYFFMTGSLAEDLQQIPTQQVLNQLGKSQVKAVSQTKLDVTVATKRKVPVRYAEKGLKFFQQGQFAAYKFDSGRKIKYRPLIGPYLQYYYNYRLIEVVKPLLEKLR